MTNQQDIQDIHDTFIAIRASIGTPYESNYNMSYEYYTDLINSCLEYGAVNG